MQKWETGKWPQSEKMKLSGEWTEWPSLSAERNVGLAGGVWRDFENIWTSSLKKVGSLLLQSLSDHSSNDWDVKKIFQGL